VKKYVHQNHLQDRKLKEEDHYQILFVFII